MISPLVAQLIAEERIAAAIRAAETARLFDEARVDRSRTRARPLRGLSVVLAALPGVLHRRRETVTPCLTC
jgi:hypothetical protein